MEERRIELTRPGRVDVEALLVQVVLALLAPADGEP